MDWQQDVVNRLIRIEDKLETRIDKAEGRITDLETSEVTRRATHKAYAQIAKRVAAIIAAATAIATAVITYLQGNH